MMDANSATVARGAVGAAPAAPRPGKTRLQAAKSGVSLRAAAGGSDSRDAIDVDAADSGAAGKGAETSGSGTIRLPPLQPAIEKAMSGTGLPAAQARRLPDLGGASSGLGADSLAGTELSKESRQMIRALRAERDFVLARINVLTQVVEQLQERERELTGKEWGTGDYEDSNDGSSREGSADEDEDAEGESDEDYVDEAGKKGKGKKAAGGRARKG